MLILSRKAGERITIAGGMEILVAAIGRGWNRARQQEVITMHSRTAFARRTTSPWLLSPLAFLFSMVVGACLEAHDWTQWRGPTRDGAAPGPAWPETLSEQNCAQIWRVPLGPSYSGPIVTSDRVFVTETKDKATEIVRALSRRDGKQIWQAEWSGAMTVPFFAAANGSWIRSTPAYDGESLFVAGMRDVLVCLNAANGQERWRVDFVEQFKTPLPSFGFASSPLVSEGFVYVQAGAALAKLDKHTGKVLWRALREQGGMMDSAFSSPILANLGGRPVLVVQTREKLCGVDPEGGQVLFEQAIPAFRGMNILTPTHIGNQLFTSSYGGKSFLYEIAGSSDTPSVNPVWENKAQGYMSSPVVIGDYLYIHLKNQRLACLDVKSGQEMWTTKPFGKYWSLVAQGERILALDQNGQLLLIRANPAKFDLLGSLQVSKDEAWAHLAVSGNELFVRELNALAAYRWQ
jgi:outer membrane protein assembly factor BamB